LEQDGYRLLLDCGPDFRQQMLRIPFARLDAVLLTHEHYDHVAGIDDLRPYSVFGDVHIYADSLTVTDLKQRIPYCFVEHKYPGVPQLHLHVLQPHDSFDIGPFHILPLKVMHGRLPILGYRINNMAYITDMKSIPEEELSYLEGLDFLIINGLRHEPHNTHQTIEEAALFAEKIGAKQARIIHLSHHAHRHEVVNRTLPGNIQVGYDGEEVNI
jgi:phosphoribosyl 1,2-cyclic phosphate phosphodiesterase